MKKEVEDRIRWLEEHNAGEITPEMVVNDAMVPDSPLHSEFNWDKDQAAWAHWLDTARSLIRSVKLVIHTDTKTIETVAYVRDPSKDKKEQGYLSVERLRTDEDSAREALLNEFKRAGSALKRAQRLAIAFNLESEVECMAKQLNKIRRNVELKTL